MFFLLHRNQMMFKSSSIIILCSCFCFTSWSLQVQSCFEVCLTNLLIYNWGLDTETPLHHRYLQVLLRPYF
jgi:hypothetical protein